RMPLRNEPAAWSLAFLEGTRLLREAAVPGPVDPSGRVANTWYGEFLEPGTVELGRARSVDGAPDAATRLVRTVEIPGPTRRTPAKRPPVAAAPVTAAARLRGSPPATDLRFMHTAGIKRAVAWEDRGDEPVITSASVGDKLAVDCGYVLSID